MQVKRIVLCDLVKVFKGSQKFAALQEEVKGEIRQSRKKVAEMAKELSRLKIDLRNFSRGSSAYEETQDEISDLTAKIKKFAEKQKRLLEKRAAEIYLDVYRDVKNEVKKFSKANGIRLVQRYSGEPINSTDSKKMLSGINRQILYADVRDITEDIIKALNRQNVSVESID